MNLIGKRSELTNSKDSSLVPMRIAGAVYYRDCKFSDTAKKIEQGWLIRDPHSSLADIQIITFGCRVRLRGDSQ